MRLLLIFVLALGLAACSPKPPIDNPQKPATNDPLFKDQWNFQVINLPAAWKKENGCSHPINIGVLDTAIIKHEDLTRVLPGYDFVGTKAFSADGDGYDNDATDSTGGGHGTHVAGIIAADSNNGIGVAGINWCAKIVPIRILGDDDLLRASEMADAIHWAIGDAVAGVPTNPNPVRLINISASEPQKCSDPEQKPFQDAINDALAKNVLVIVSGTNRAAPVTNAWPAGCQGVIAVGATDDHGNMTGYSGYGPEILLAPGFVLSTDPTGPTKYGRRSGSSMAAPHITGLASLILSQNPNLTAAQVKQKLINSATRSKDCPKERCGYGLIDADKALN